MSHIEHLFNNMLHYYIDRKSIDIKRKSITDQLTHFQSLRGLPFSKGYANQAEYDTYVRTMIENLNNMNIQLEPFDENLIDQLIFHEVPTGEVNPYLFELDRELKDLDYVIIEDTSLKIFNKIITVNDFTQFIHALINNDVNILSKSSLPITAANFIKTIPLTNMKIAGVIDNAQVTAIVTELIKKYTKEAITTINNYLNGATWKKFFTDYFICKYTLDLKLDKLYFISEKSNTSITIIHILTGHKLTINENIKNVISNLIWIDGINKSYLPISITDKIIINEISGDLTSSIHTQYDIVMRNQYDVKDNCNNLFWKYAFMSSDGLLQHFYYNIIKHIQETQIELEIFDANITTINNNTHLAISNIEFGLNINDEYLVDMSIIS